MAKNCRENVAQVALANARNPVGSVERVMSAVVLITTAMRAQDLTDKEAKQWQLPDHFRFWLLIRIKAIRSHQPEDELLR